MIETDINLELYRNFYLVAKHKSVSKAAEELHVSQPAVTQSIKSLEEKLGSPVFIRANRKMNLTEAGKALYEKVESALNLISDAETDFGLVNAIKKGEVRIGISSVLSKSFLSNVLKEFIAKYPDIKVYIVNGVYDDLVAKLSQDKLDFIIYNDVDEDVTPNTFKKELLGMQEYVFARNPELTRLPEEVTDDNIGKLVTIAQENGSNTRKVLEKNFKNIDPQITVVSQDLACYIASKGMGVCFALRSTVKSYPSLKEIDIDKKIYCSVYLLTRKGKKLTNASKQFVSALLSNKKF